MQYKHVYGQQQRCQRVPSRLTPVHGISKNNAFSGHILPNYAASLKYGFSAENSAGTIREALFQSGAGYTVAASGNATRIEIRIILLYALHQTAR